MSRRKEVPVVPDHPEAEPIRMLTVRMPDSMHVALRILAANRRCRISDIILSLLRQELAA